MNIPNTKIESEPLCSRIKYSREAKVKFNTNLGNNYRPK